MPNNSIVNLSKLRRATNPRELTRRIGVILNPDGSVFDKKKEKQFSTLADWYKEVS